MNGNPYYPAQRGLETLAGQVHGLGADKAEHERRMTQAGYQHEATMAGLGMDKRRLESNLETQRMQRDILKHQLGELRRQDAIEKEPIFADIAGLPKDFLDNVKKQFPNKDLSKITRQEFEDNYVLPRFDDLSEKGQRFGQKLITNRKQYNLELRKLHSDIRNKKGIEIIDNRLKNIDTSLAEWTKAEEAHRREKEIEQMKLDAKTPQNLNNLTWTEKEEYKRAGKAADAAQKMLMAGTDDMGQPLTPRKQEALNGVITMAQEKINALTAKSEGKAVPDKSKTTLAPSWSDYLTDDELQSVTATYGKGR